MPELMILAGDAGRGTAQYEAGLFTFPDGSSMGVESATTVQVHAGVEGKLGWAGQVVGGLRGGLGLAAGLELSMPLSLAASSLGAGLSALDEGPRRRDVVEIGFGDGRSLVALVDAGLAALIENDRAVAVRAIARGTPGAASQEAEGLAAQAAEAASGAVQSVGGVLSSALSFVRRARREQDGENASAPAQPPTNRS